MAKYRLPDFIIVGAQRCGTTALVRYFYRRPDTGIASFKHGEVHFFDREDRWGLGLEWYGKLIGKKKNKLFVGEKSPGYLPSRLAMERCASTIPNVKIIILLRDPVLRWHSAFILWNKFHRKRTLEEFFYENVDDQVWRSAYVKQLKYVFELFPRENIGIFFNEDMRDDFPKFRWQVSSFLNLQNKEIEIPKRRSRANKEFPMFDEINEYFRNLNQELRSFLRKHDYDIERVEEWLKI